MDGNNLLADNNRTSTVPSESIDSIGDLELLGVYLEDASRNGDTILEKF